MKADKERQNSLVFLQIRQIINWKIGSIMHVLRI
jgi:hypothetical protein